MPSPRSSSAARAEGAAGSRRSPDRARNSTPLAAAIRDAYKGRLTQVQLASEVGVAQNTVSRWSTGEVEPCLDDIVKIESACGMPRGFILRQAGFVADNRSPEEVIASDHRLDRPRRELLLAAYKAALSQSKASSKA